MKKTVLALMASAIVFGGMVSTAQADTTTVTGGTVNFVGQVVDAACSVSADSVDQTVTLSQVRWRILPVQVRRRMWHYRFMDLMARR